MKLYFCLPLQLNLKLLEK
ncbi:hypothetical protein LINPERPRIM_LOCUS19071 [Linum perenne]